MKVLIFFQVGEALPLSDAAVDAVVGTLVLCSVKDVDTALKGIYRVLVSSKFRQFNYNLI